MQQIQKQWWQRPQTKNVLKGLAFISPWLIGYVAFTLYPILASA